jgi:hypothetical protein
MREERNIDDLCFLDIKIPEVSGAIPLTLPNWKASTLPRFFNRSYTSVMSSYVEIYIRQ